MRISKLQEHNSQKYYIDSSQVLLGDKGQQVHIVGCGPGAKLLSTIVLFDDELAINRRETEDDVNRRLFLIKPKFKVIGQG